jgi:hypothetical protein
MVRVDMDAVTATGRGIASIGEGIGRLATSLQTEQDRNEEQEVQRRLLEIEQQQSRTLDESRRTLSGDPSGFADRTRAGFTASGRSAFADARSAGLSERALTRLAYGLSGLRERLQTQATSFELNQRGAYGEQQITTDLADLSRQYEQAQDDAERDRLVREAEDRVRRGRIAYGYSNETEARLLSSARQMIERGLVTRGDPWTALLELEQGDQRARAPSTGQVSDAGIAQLERLLQPPGQARTPAERRVEQQRLRVEAGRLSRWMGENLVGEDGQRIPLTQLQHDALVAYALRQARDGGKPEDFIEELLPELRGGTWGNVAAAIRAGSMSSLEQPAPGGRTTAPGGLTSAPDLGSVSAKYESGGRGVGFISSGQGDPGGPSYGIHQLSGVSSMGAFLASPEGEPYRAEFGSTRPMTADFNEIYRRIAARDPEGFAAAQRAFYTRTHYEPARQAAEQAGFDVSSRAIQEALFSIGVQHGGARTIIDRAASQLGAGASVEDQIRALYEARSQYVRGLSSLPESTRQAVLSRYQREVRDVLALARDGAPSSTTTEADPHLSTLGDMVLGQAPSSHLSRLSPERRSVVRRDLVHAVRGEATDGINSDIESITRTGRPRTLPDGTTWLERARRMPIFTPMQLAGFERRIKTAEARFRALNGLSDMTPEEMEQRIADLDTSRVGPGEDYATAAQVRDSTARARERLLQLRRSDPALWASGTYLIGARGVPQYNARGEVVTSPAEDDVRVQPAREVVEAFGALARRHPQLQIQFNEQDGTFTATAEQAPGEISPSQVRPQALRITDPRLTPEDRRLIIEARLAAMARVGIPEGERRALSAAEARELLGLPSSTTGMTSDRYSRTLREAADRAEHLFGPRYARLAFETALGFRQQNQDQRSIGESISSQLPGGGRDSLSMSDLRNLSALRDLTMEESLWRYGSPSYPLPDVGEGLPFGPLMGIQAPPAPPSSGWFGSTPSPQVPPAPMPPSGLPPGGWRQWAEQQVGVVGPTLPAGSAGARGGMPANMPSVPGVSVAPTGAGPAQFGRPSQDDVSALLESPLRRQEAFDRRFGPGSAAMYLRQAQEGGVQTGRPIRQGR